MLHLRPKSTISFYIQVYKDWEMADWCLRNFRDHFPENRLLIISDGCDSEEWPKVAKKYNAIYRQCDRLKLISNGGKMLHRNLSFLLEEPTDYFFKFDTDTGFHRPFKYLPRTDGVFGTVQYNSVKTACSIQGGIVGYTRKAVETLIESKVFLDPKLTDFQVWSGGCETSKSLVKEYGTIREDWVLGYCVEKCKLPIYDYGEVKSFWRKYIPNQNKQWAVTHPCKNYHL